MKSKAAVFLCIVMMGLMFEGCGPRETLVPHLGNAENCVFTSDGRLFVTGARIWEITEDSGTYGATDLTGGGVCVFTGIVEYEDYLFSVCSEDDEKKAWLMRAHLDETPVFEKIYPLTDFTIANGMAVDRSGQLYIADETLINTRGKIVRLNLDGNEVPGILPGSDTIWLTGDEGAQSPNGMTIIGNYLFFTNFDVGNLFNIRASVKRVAIAEGGHGEVETVFERRAFANSSLFDGLTSTSYLGTDYLITTDYLRGTVVALEAFGNTQATPVYETAQDMFAGPTSCITGQGLGFDMTDLLVTEGGIVSLDARSQFGNRLSVIRYQSGQ